MSNRTKKAMSNALGIPLNDTPIEIKSDVTDVSIIDAKPIVPATPPDPPSPESEHVKQDYKLARGTLRKVIKQGSSVMEELKAVAVQTENPRAYEVLATMIKTLAETTSHLYDLQIKNKQLNDIPKGNGSGGDNINIDKAVFVGSTADLLRKIKEEKQ